MEVLGVDPLYRLVVPRVAATIFVSVMIIGIVIAAGIGGGYFFNVIISGGSAGSFLSSFTTLATLTDLIIAIIKAAIFGWLAAIVGSYKGLTAGRWPLRRRPGRQRGRDHHVHAAVLRERADHRGVLPGRPAAGDVMSAITTFGASVVRAPASPARGVRRPAAVLRPRDRLDPPRDPPLQAGDLEHPGGGGLRLRRPVGDRRHGRRHRVPVVLRRHRGRHAGLRLAEPDRRLEVHRVHLGVLQHPRGRAAGRPRSRWPRPSAAATPPASARCGSARRSTPSR